MDEEAKRQVEAVLFSCGRKIELDEIAKLVGSSADTVKRALAELSKDYDARGSSMMLIEEGPAWKMTVREKYLPVVRKITPYMEFSKTIMETLAVVAWKQPILQSDVIRIRTNKAYEHIAELEKLGFLAKEKHGRSFLLKLSQKFYDYFDLRDDVDVRNLFKHIKDDEPEQKKVPEYEEPAAEETEKKEEKAEVKIEDKISEDKESEDRPLEIDEILNGQKDK